MMQLVHLTFVFLMLSVVTVGAPGGVASAADAGSVNKGDTPRYTFSWPLDGTHLKPRGGSTKGAPVTLDTAPAPQWHALQEPNISDFERDRRAILAMAGTYRVTFDFLEVVSFKPLDKPIAPYQSWGTEKIYVDIDTGESISLAHILEMRFVQQDGSVSEPMVTKHWRQDWRYQPTHIVEHKGRDRWQRRSVKAVSANNVWSQTVYQVDESPRYASLGRWSHNGSFSEWLSGETWRPLPRREWSVRDDYQVLIGTNRHVIQPTGWIQEENNLKTVLTPARSPSPEQPYLAREYGVARYERIKDADFSAADRYYKQTRVFWQEVRDAWTQAFASEETITLKGPVDKLGLFRPLFEHADELANGKGGKSGPVIRDALRNMGVEWGAEN
jgi:hypothetical protein